MRARDEETMKITEVRTIALSGATHDTGWPGGTKSDEQMNTLLEVKTDEGLTGIGSVFTSQALVEAALQLLRPMLIGETGLEAERVAEKLRQMTFWQGRGGSVEHAISGIDIALWDLLGQGARAARLAAPRRQLSRPHQALRLDSLRRSARPPGQAPAADVARLPGDQDGLAPVRARQPAARRAADQDRARDRGRRRRADGRRRRKRAVLAARRLVGPRDRQDAGRLRDRLVRGGAPPGRRRRLQGAPPDLARPRSPPARS